MKQIAKYVATICLLAASQTAFSQTAEETLEWLNINKHKIGPSLSSSNNVKPDRWNLIVFAADKIKIQNYDSSGYNTILYKEIRKVEKEYDYSVRIISNQKIENNQKYIRLGIDEDWRDRFFKAIENMAKLAGAKLINDDLF